MLEKSFRVYWTDSSKTIFFKHGNAILPKTLPNSNMGLFVYQDVWN